MPRAAAAAAVGSLQLTYDEADVMFWQRIPVPL
jgi:hypothetical protein